MQYLKQASQTVNHKGSQIKRQTIYAATMLRLNSTKQ